MQSIYHIILIVHIISGFLGLVSGTAALSLTSKIKLHKKIGQLFFYSMLFVFLTSTAMCYLKTNVFLLLVGFFSFYMACTGYRVLAHKKLATLAYAPLLKDKIIFLFGFLSGISICVLGFLILKNNSGFAVVCFFFGLISIFLALNDIQKFYKTPLKLRSYQLDLGP